MTEIAAISVDLLFVEGVRALRLDDGLFLPSGGSSLGPPPFELLDPMANPAVGSFDLRGFEFGMTSVTASWRSDSGAPVAFLDNIAFHPIPEPRHLGLLGLIGFLSLTGARSRTIRACLEWTEKASKGRRPR